MHSLLDVFFVIVNGADMNFNAQVFAWTFLLSIFLGTYPEEELLNCMAIQCFFFMCLLAIE